MLIISVVTCALLILTFTTWWTHRFADAHYKYATNCYAKMAAAHQLPGIPAKFGSFEATEVSRHYYKFAEEHGSQLGMARDAVHRKLTHDIGVDAAYYARLAATGDRRAIAASFNDLDRCLNGDGSPRGELVRT
jgi:hypothetical protein